MFNEPKLAIKVKDSQSGGHKFESCRILSGHFLTQMCLFKMTKNKQNDAGMVHYKNSLNEFNLWRLKNASGT